MAINRPDQIVPYNQPLNVKKPKNNALIETAFAIVWALSAHHALRVFDDISPQ